MKMKIKIIIGTLAALLLAMTPTFVQADATASSDEFFSYILVMGMTQEPDPITCALWDQLIPDSEALNTDGAIRLDGPPYIQLSTTTDGPVVVWAYNNGSEFDIAFSSWNGTEWEEIEFLTSSTDSEIDPRLYISPNGDYHVTYWVKDAEEIYVISRPSGSQFWGVPEQLSSTGRHPAILFDGDVRLIAFEREGDAGGQEIVVNRKDAGLTTEEVTASTAYSETLNIMLHKLGNRIWMDWIHSEDSLGYTQYFNGIWGVSPSHVPWPDHSWIGSEDARRTVQFEISRDE
jgi:hypothetical protein